MSEIERLRALAHYAYERDRLPVDGTEATALTECWRGMHAIRQGDLRLEHGRKAHRALCAVPGKPRGASWRRWLARSLLSSLIIDPLFVGANRSLNVGLTSSDYVSLAQIGGLLYVALALALLARWFWRLG